jgi:tetratricopeptide (TPR) repeat protein
LVDRKQRTALERNDLVTSVLEKLKKIGDLHRLKAAVKRDPTPAAFAVLAERYISLGKPRDALRVTMRGLSMFPTSERLNSISTYLRKDRLKEEITRLKKEAGENPGPATFVSLARCYLELGDHDRTLAVCDECASRYPLNENPYLVAGEVHIARFFQHLAGNDGIEGEALLRRALRLNAQNLNARLLLAQVYYSIGAIEQLDEELTEITRLSPDYEDLIVFRSGMEIEVPEEEADGSVPGPSMAERFRKIEADEAFAYSPESFPASALANSVCTAQSGARVDRDRVSDSVVDLSNQEGVHHVTALGRDGEALAVAGNTGELTGEDFAVLCAEIVSTASDATRRMEFGALGWCTVEGDFGGIAINQVRGLSLSASFGRPLKNGAARRLVGEFAARSFSTEEEG